MKQKTIRKLWTIVSAIVIFSMIAWTIGIGVAYGATYDVMIQRSDVTFRPDPFFAGDLVRVYATVKNIGDKDVQGNVFFSENGTAIGTPPPFSVRARGAEEEVWVDWQPAVTGDRQIFVRVVTAPETRDEDSMNNEMIVPITVAQRPSPTPSSSTTSAGPSGTGSVFSQTAPPPIASTQPPAAAPTSVPPLGVRGGEGELRVDRNPSQPPLTVRGGASLTKGRDSTVIASAKRTPAPATDAVVVPAATEDLIPVASPFPPYDTQLRDLLGRPASIWARLIPIAASAIALIALAALIGVAIRRRRLPTHDRTEAPPDTDVGRRSTRTR